MSRIRSSILTIVTLLLVLIIQGILGVAQEEQEPLQQTVLPVVEVQLVTNSPVMLGEPLRLSLVVTKNTPVTLTSMPQEFEAGLQLPAGPEAEEQEPTADTLTLPPPPIPQPAVLRFELDQSQTVVPQQTDGQTVERYHYILAAPPQQAGEFVIPAFTVRYRTASGKEAQQESDAASIFVMNPNTGNLAIKTDYRFLIFPAILAATLILGGLVVFFYLKTRKSRKREETAAAPMLPPGEIAHRELAEIQAMKLPGKGEFKHYYILISESVRKFLGAEYHFPVLERTTAEILSEIQDRNMPDTIKRRVSTFLPEADMVKFAKYLPTLEEADQAMEQALKIVDESLDYHRPLVMQEEAGGSP